MSHSSSLGKFRVALCSVGELFGGVERQLLGLGEYLKSRGADPLMILFHDRELARRARDIGLRTLIVPCRHSYDLGLAKRLAGILREARIEVVHVHGYKAMVNCGLAHRCYGFAVVKTEHGCREPAQGNPGIWMKTRLYQRLDRWFVRHCDATVCYVTDDMRQHYGQAHRGLERHTVYNGIEPLDRRATSRPPEYDDGHFHLAIVGRITGVKGITYALQALAAEDMPARVRLNVVGTGPLQVEMAQKATLLGLDEKVRFLGFRRNVYDYLAHCDALLMPSLYEGLPYTLLEAMSLGVPILASRVGGLKEILIDGQTALLFESRDVRGIVTAITRLMADPELAVELVHKAREDQEARFSLQEMGEAYWWIYSEALKRVDIAAD